MTDKITIDMVAEATPKELSVELLELTQNMTDEQRHFLAVDLKANPDLRDFMQVWCGYLAASRATQ